MKEPKDKTTMTAREVAVLIEGLKGQFRIFGEDLSGVKDKINALFAEVGAQKEQIFIIKADINLIKADINEVKVRLGRVEGDLTVIKTDFNKRLTRLEALK